MAAQAIVGLSTVCLLLLITAVTEGASPEPTKKIYSPPPPPMKSPPPPPPKSSPPPPPHKRSPPLPPPKRSPPPPPKHSPPPPSRWHSPPPPPPRRRSPPPPRRHSPPPPPPRRRSPPPALTTPPPPSLFSPPPPQINPFPPPPPASTTPPPPSLFSPPPLQIFPSPPPPPASTTPPPPSLFSPPPPQINPSSPPPPASTTPPPLSLFSPPPPPSSESVPKKVKCPLKNYPFCYGIEHSCPAGCPDQCQVDCITCSPVCDCNRPGAVCQDPRFVGADGIAFYFHGQKERDFCIVSDSNLHINAHFIGKRNENMKRDFTWVQSLGILFDNHKLFVGARKTSTWDDSVDRLSLAFDGEPVYVLDGEEAKWQSMTSPNVSVTRTRDANSVQIDVQGNFEIKATVVPITEKDSRIHNYGITQEDCFAHLDLGFKFYTLSGEVNGVLGQTYASSYVSKVKMGLSMPVLGGQKEFFSSNLFATDCAVARFTGQFAGGNSSENLEYSNYLNCGSGIDGRGVVCKR